MSQVSQLSPELSRGLLQMARALLVAVRNWTLYPPEHPAVARVGRTASRPRSATRRSAPVVRHRRDARHADGRRRRRPTAARRRSPKRRRCSTTATSSSSPSSATCRPTTLQRVARALLTLDPAERRRRGGPARIWASEGHASIAIEQIDYQKVLAREEGEVAEPVRRGRSLALDRAVDRRRPEGGLRRARRSSACSRSPAARTTSAIWPTAVVAPQCTLDGSPMITSQAATVLAAFRHLDEHRLGDVARAACRRS